MLTKTNDKPTNALPKLLAAVDQLATLSTVPRYDRDKRKWRLDDNKRARMFRARRDVYLTAT